MLKNREWACSL